MSCLARRDKKQIHAESQKRVARLQLPQRHRLRCPVVPRQARVRGDPMVREEEEKPCDRLETLWREGL